MTHPSEESRPGIRRIPVFDLGGVLVDWNPRHLFRRFFPGDPDALERFLAEIDFPRWNRLVDAGMPVAEAVRVWTAEFPRFAEPIRAFETDWVNIIAGPIPGMPELLGRLREKEIPAYALSNISAEKLPILVSRYPFLERLERIVVSAEIGINKPDPRLFGYFLERTGRRKEELFFIDDLEENVAGARKAGWSALRFTGAAALEKEFSALGIL
jgi:2-haloacid dehalogenase